MYISKILFPAVLVFSGLAQALPPGNEDLGARAPEPEPIFHRCRHNEYWDRHARRCRRRGGHRGHFQEGKVAEADEVEEEQ
ncbi:hypothetical protein GGR58DRAFT_507530 [Xylaria digitata]|nr:hypothetical protein GGR58DRAFT_507530 [Xylaria digitata]